MAAVACLAACSSEGGKPPSPATHLIAGTVSGATLAGVTIALSGAASATTSTDAGGSYAFAGLADGAYTVTPSKAGFAFAPTSLAVSLAGADVTGRNFTATADQAASGSVFPRDPYPGMPLQEGNMYPALAVDATGRIHLAFLTNYTPTGGIVYATCSAGCATAASWHSVVIEDPGPGSPLGPSMAVDAAGQPRLVYVRTVSGTSSFRYLACDAADCTAAAAWKGTDVATGLGPFWELDHGALALDGQGRPAFLRGRRTGGGLLLHRCTAVDCTVPGTWRETELAASGIFSMMSLAFDGAGTMHLGLRRDSVAQVAYWRCASACETATSWQEVVSWDLGASGLVRLRVDGSGRLRMVAYSSSATVVPDQIVYMACDTSCADGTSWLARVVGLPAKDGSAGLDLALDAAGSPRIAFSVQDLSPRDGIGLALCDADCAADTATWLGGTVEEAIAIPPLLLPLGCNVGGWWSGENARVGVGPGGAIVLVHDATHRHSGSPLSCPAGNDQYLVRVAIP